MLSTLRGAGKAAMGGVVVLLVAAFALDSRQRPMALDTQCAVRVTGKCVLPRDFHAAFRLAVGGSLEPKEIKRLKVNETILEGLAERELLAAEAERLGLGVSDDALNKELADGRFHFSLPVERYALAPMVRKVDVTARDTKKFDFDTYKRVMNNYARMSPKDFKATQERELLAQRLREVVRASAVVSPGEVKEELRANGEKVTVRVAQLERDWFARFVVEPSDAEVESFTQAQGEAVSAAWEKDSSSYSADCSLIREIVLHFPPGAEDSDREQVRRLARELTAMVQRAPNKAEAFGLLARTHSGARTAARGGRAGCEPALAPAPGQEPAPGGVHGADATGTNGSGAEASATRSPLALALASLAPGGVAAPIESALGLRLVLLEDRVAADRLESVGKALSARRLATEAAATRAMEQLATALRAAVQSGQSLQDGTEQLARAAVRSSAPRGASVLPVPRWEELALESPDRPRVEISAPFSRRDAIKPFSNVVGMQSPKQLAFSLTKVDDLYPEAIATRDGIALMQLKERTEATLDATSENAAFSELRQQAEAEALARYVEVLKERLKPQVEFNPKFLSDAEQPSDDS